MVVALRYLVLGIGGNYTYSEAPIVEWMQQALSLDRNPFDRVGHLMQGFTPALVAREGLLRTTSLHRGWWLRWIVVSTCLAFSAFYELLEWRVVAVFYPDAGPECLGIRAIRASDPRPRHCCLRSPRRSFST